MGRISQRTYFVRNEEDHNLCVGLGPRISRLQLQLQLMFKLYLIYMPSIGEYTVVQRAIDKHS